MGPGGGERAVGRGEAVLIRAVAPLDNLDVMARQRGIPPGATPSRLRGISNGPGKLTQAMAIDLGFDGKSFGDDDLRLVDLGRDLSNRNIGVSPRIGITRAADFPLRFFIKDSPWLSR